MVFDSAPLENVADVLQNLSQVVLCVFSSLLILSQGTQDAVKRKVRRFRTAAVAVSCPRSCLRERKRRRCRSSCRNSAWIKRWRRSSTLEEHGTAKKGREIVQNFDQTRSTDDNRISNVYDIVRNIAYPTGCKMLQIGVGSLQSPQAEAVVLTLHICHFIVFFVHQHL